MRTTTRPRPSAEDRVRCTPENVAALLQQLDDATGGPAEELRRLGVKGQRCRAWDCPLVRYLRLYINADFSATCLQVYHNGHPAFAVYNPASVTQLVWRVDQGYYPDLIEGATP